MLILRSHSSYLHIQFLESIPISDDAVQTIEDNSVELTGLVAFSRQLHYLLSLITKNSARLVVRGNLGLNRVLRLGAYCHVDLRVPNMSNMFSP